MVFLRTGKNTNLKIHHDLIMISFDLDLTVFWRMLDTNFPNGLTLKLQDFKKPRDDKITWHEVIKALSRLVFWKYKLRGKLLLKIKLSYCSCPLTSGAGPSGHLGPLERYKRFMQSPRARYREYRSKSWRYRVIKSDLTNHVPFSCHVTDP